MMVPISEEQFQSFVADAMDELPAELAKRMSNVAIVVQDAPGSEAPEEHDSLCLLGLYQGVPLSGRSNYFGVLPDRITLYKLNIERAAGSPGNVAEVVRRTVIHEIAHHFGIDDDRLDELGWG